MGPCSLVCRIRISRWNLSWNRLCKLGLPSSQNGHLPSGDCWPVRKWKILYISKNHLIFSHGSVLFSVENPNQPLEFSLESSWQSLGLPSSQNGHLPSGDCWPVRKWKILYISKNH